VSSQLWLAAALGGSLLVAAAAQETPANKTVVERTGTLVPSHPTEIKLGLESYAGPLELVEVVAHGAQAQQGDVLARFDTKAIDDLIAAATRDLRSTEIRQQNAREQARLDEEAAAQRLEAANDALNDATEALANFEKTELALKRRGEELTDSSMKDNIDDQKDELAQLEKMYKDDETTDATEEIVLRRSRRGIARSQASFELQRARRQFDTDFAERKQREAKQKAVRDAQRNLDRTQRQVEMERRTRADAQARLDPEMKEAREKVEKLARDRDRLTIRAPAAGTTLHGARDDYKPGRTPPRYEIGGGVTAKAVLFTVAPAAAPGALQVALDLPESQVLALSQGMAAKVTAIVDPSVEMVGRLRYDRFPSARSGAAPENSYDATVELGGTAPVLVAGMRCKVVLEGGHQ
jgi:hypothetical protein